MRSHLSLQFFLSCILIILHLNGIAQSNFSISEKTGFGINSSLDLNDAEVSKASWGIFQMGLNYEFRLYKNFYFETGLAGRAIFSSGKINNISYQGRTLRLLAPIKLGFKLSDKWMVYTGVVFQNNKDFTKIDLREKYFWRKNLLMEGKYHFVNKWYLAGSFSFGLRNLPDAFYVNDSRTGILVGVGRRI